MNISTKPLLQKLGLKEGMRIAVLGFADREFMLDMSYETCLKEDTGYAAVLFYASSVEKLSSLRQAKSSIVSNGMLWVVYPKGVKAITQRQVFFHGNTEGFVDCKVCRFSSTETALKFVRRLTERS